MRPLHRLSLAIDRLNRFVGRTTAWLILASILVSAGNAVVRKVFGVGSNAWLEAQWYLYGAAFLLVAGYVLMVDEHVRIDALSQRFPPRLRAWIDIVGLLLFVLPLCALMVAFGGDYLWDAWIRGERSFNADGLVRWPARVSIPLGFGLLALQAVSESIKRLEFLRGLRARPGTSEEDLPEFMGPASAGSTRP